MKKMKLAVDELRVESFEMDGPESPRGTVDGRESGAETCGTCFVTCGETCDTCEPDCGPTRAWSCNGYGCTDNTLVCYQ